MSVTVQDVAKSARVSPATVSRVLNNNGDITPKTRLNVENAIRLLGYQRAATRRGRRVTEKKAPRATESLVMLIPDTHIEAMMTPLTGQVLHGAEAVARKHGFQFLLSRLSEEDGLSPTLSSGHVDGMIVRAGGNVDVTSILPAVPIVWFFYLAETVTFGDRVYPDNQLIGQMAARYLTDRGHQHLAVLDSAPGHPEARLREDSFRHYAQAAGCTVLNIRCTAETIAQATAQTLEQNPEVKGFFLPIGDASTEAFVRTLSGRGLRLCEEVDLISCNNDMALLRAVDPRLPNIDIQADEVGRMAAETLLWRIQNPGEHRRCILIEPRLVLGQK